MDFDYTVKIYIPSCDNSHHFCDKNLLLRENVMHINTAKEERQGLCDCSDDMKLE